MGPWFVVPLSEYSEHTSLIKNCQCYSKPYNCHWILPYQMISFDVENIQLVKAKLPGSTDLIVSLSSDHA